MILIATHDRDIGADFVIRHLIERRAPFVRVDTNTLGTSERHFGFENGSAFLRYDRFVLTANQLQAVWARRFTSPSVLEKVHPDYRAFVARELADVREAFFDTLSAPLMNKYDADRQAGNRVVQSSIARKIGFSVPETIITQDAIKAKDFMLRYDRTITKAISFGLVSSELDQIAHTSRIDGRSSLAGLSGCPVLIQPEIKKKCEWRVTTVGPKVFAARTKAGTGVDQLDWRRSEDVSGIFEKADLPVEISERLLLLCEYSNIIFGAHDLIETPDEEFYFLETNPAGQWGWLEVTLGLPIGEAIATWLISGGGQS